MVPAISVSAAWNSPHVPPKKQQVINHSAFSASPKTLDPAKAYSTNEAIFTAQIYEPVLQYDFLARPYRLVPLTASVMPKVTYYSQAGKPLPSDVNPKEVAYSVYDITIRKGIFYQNHPAFAQDAHGQYRNHKIKESQLKDIYKLSDFPFVGTRELDAYDYAYQIKRLAHPKLSSPIFGLMSEHIVGLEDYEQRLRKLMQENRQPFLDLRKHSLEGVKVIDRFHYQIKIKGIYPQFLFWLSMPFFSPIPWEADLFYSQKGMAEHNISWDWYPVGTGPYWLSENDPNRQMVLTKNPNFHLEVFPGSKDKANRSDDAGKPLPFVDQFIFSLDKESIPRWNKFLQGYYDRSGVSSDSFDQVVSFDRQGKPMLTDEMKDKGIQLTTQIQPSIFYLGFNMLDPVVGGYDEQHKALRQAISIALDYEEYIAIFMNGRGLVAHGPLAPGVFGYEQEVNPYIYDLVEGKPVRKSIDEAKALMVQAGYKDGVDPKTKKPLVLNFDVAGSANPDDQAYYNWLRKQFAKLGVQLNIRATHYNRFQDIMRKGQGQIFTWGWAADYPDPENFLFLLYGPNGKAEFGGENAANYVNPEADTLFEKIRVLPNGPKRLALIRQFNKIVQEDSPWLFGFHPVSYTLSHAWVKKRKPHAIANNTLKYVKIDDRKRQLARAKWNQPILWPLAVLLLCIAALLLPLFIAYRRRERKPATKRVSSC
jgi:oligopeptide transport system substrate-binding protein